MLGVVRVVAARRRAFLGFRHRRLVRLPHLQRHQPTKLATFRIENSCRGAHMSCSLGERGFPVLAICSYGAIDGLVDSSGGIGLESTKRLPGGGICGRDAHEWRIRFT